MAEKVDQILQRPLYVFSLPEELLATLTLKTGGNYSVAETNTLVQEEPARPTEKLESRDSSPAKATSCSLCGLTFTSLQEQRGHVRSDLHGFNLKQKMKGLKAVDEAEFEKLIEDLDESISGSESSDLDDSSDDDPSTSKSKDTTLSVLLKKQARITNPNYDDFKSTKQKQGASTPMLWFTSSALPNNMSLGVYRAIFTSVEQEDTSSLVEALRRKQLASFCPPPTQSSKGQINPASGAINPGPHYFLCMIGGGHFAAMIVSLAPKVGKKHNGVEERQAIVLAHKTFHRYTTRRKQGGSQSANDASKGAAHSAGSSLRRYNEAALTNEVRELLAEWKSMIDSAELHFIRASGSTNRRTLFGPYDGQVLRHNDTRNRGFPFSTRRATQGELMRAFVELTRVKVSRIDETSLTTAIPDTSSKPTLVSKPKPTKSSKIDESIALHTTQLVAMIRRSKAPALISYINNNSLSPSFAFQPESTYHHTPTPLHLAASLNNPTIVLALLTKARADPTIANEEGRTPFALAGDRPTRDSFRVARSELGESFCDWDAAGVPVPLSKSDKEVRDQRDKEEKASQDAQEKERRKRETERLRNESEREERERLEKRLCNGRKVGSIPQKSAADIREEESRGMTPEMRARLERERRARAAEERIKRMQQGG